MNLYINIQFKLTPFIISQKLFSLLTLIPYQLSDLPRFIIDSLNLPQLNMVRCCLFELWLCDFFLLFQFFLLHQNFNFDSRVTNQRSNQMLKASDE
jgi:hypothetical protein